MLAFYILLSSDFLIREKKASKKGVANKRKKWNKEKGGKASLEGKR